MAKKKEVALSPEPEERLQAALVPDWEQPYKIPGNWCWLHLLHSFTNCTDSKKKIPQKEYLQNGKFAVVDQGQDLVGGYTDHKEMVFSGNLPIIIFGDHTRCVKYIDFPFAQGADGVKVLKPKPFFNEKAFYYAFQTIDIPNMGYRRHFPLFDQYAIPLPPLSEQQRIVDRIEILFDKLDEAKRKTQDALDSFEVRRAAVLHRAFTGELTARWRREHGVGLGNWRSLAFGLLTENFDAKRVPLSREQRASMRRKYDYYGASGIIDKVENYLFEGKYLLIGEDGANLVTRSKPIAFIADGQYWVNNHAHVLRTNSQMIMDFLCYYINSIDLTPYVTGSAQPKLTQSKMNTIPIPVPSLQEQGQIVSILSAVFIKEQQVKDTAEAVMEQISHIKKSILAHAFRGELGTSDPTEESASELVKRVLNKGEEVVSKPKAKTKRIVIPAEIKSVLSNAIEEEIIRVLIRSAPEAVSIQTIMSISKKKFELMDALRSLEKKQLVLRTSAGKCVLTR